MQPTHLVPFVHIRAPVPNPVIPSFTTSQIVACELLMHRHWTHCAVSEPAPLWPWKPTWPLPTLISVNSKKSLLPCLTSSTKICHEWVWLVESWPQRIQGMWRARTLFYRRMWSLPPLMVEIPQIEIGFRCWIFGRNGTPSLVVKRLQVVQPCFIKSWFYWVYFPVPNNELVLSVTQLCHP